ncbi:glycosyltransferase family 2 protein [Uliginosibacterium gangwonense]|uniref:glycosyltransferase family 2 protein n=1 Tax=Uliginosibacterium gangwonense TaxID=392736 RepID=UPI00037FBBE0|nr:glycosyltransferase [Uliginosibacterium gangwonense]
MTKVAQGIKVSVVIPTKNAGPQLGHVLHVLMSQQTAWPFEVLVVDSGSTDGTADLVKRYPTVRLIEIPASEFGHGKTRNFAIANTTGDYIAMLTQDALPANPIWLAELVKAIETDTQIAGVFGRHIAYPDASPFTRIEMEQHFLGFLPKPVIELDDRIRYEREEGYRQYLYFFSDNNAMLRRSVWQEIPYPEVDFAEDQAWARLIIEAGFRKAYAHDAVVYHSHNYGFIERLQRSFDESFALNRLFSYKHGQGFLHAMRSLIAITLRDASFSLKTKLIRTHFRYVVSMPLDNLMRVIGHYLGANGNRIPQNIRLRLSRDRRLMMAESESGTK